MAIKRLRKITQEAFDKALQNHFLYQKGGNDSKKMVLQNRDFSDIRIMQTDLSFADFEGSDFSGLDGYDSGIYSHHLYQTILTGANCQGVNFGSIDLGKAASMKDTILINAIFDSRKLTDKQKTEAIFTEEQYNDYLEKQNEKVKKQEVVIKNQAETIQKKAETIKKTSEKQSKGMLDIFSGLQLSFFREELLWMIFAFCIFLIIFSIAETIVAFINPGLATIILFGLFGGIIIVGVILSWIGEISEQQENTNKRTIGAIISSIFKTIGVLLFSGVAVYVINASIEKWDKVICKTSDAQNCLSIEKVEISMLPITFILLSLLWFSVHQYGRAKKLRIEQQNKQAMIHYMQAVIAQDGNGVKESALMPQLAPFFANAIIHRPFSQDNYDPQLPIDEVKKVIDMAKLFQK